MADQLEGRDSGAGELLHPCRRHPSWALLGQVPRVEPFRGRRHSLSEEQTRIAGVVSRLSGSLSRPFRKLVIWRNEPIDRALRHKVGRSFRRHGGQAQDAGSRRFQVRKHVLRYWRSRRHRGNRLAGLRYWSRPVRRGLFPGGQRHDSNTPRHRARCRGRVSRHPLSHGREGILLRGLLASVQGGHAGRSDGAGHHGRRPGLGRRGAVSAWWKIVAKRRVAAIDDLDAAEFMPHRPRIWSLTGAFSALTGCAYRAHKASRGLRRTAG